MRARLSAFSIVSDRTCSHSVVVMVVVLHSGYSTASTDLCTTVHIDTRETSRLGDVATSCLLLCYTDNSFQRILSLCVCLHCTHECARTHTNTSIPVAVRCVDKNRQIFVRINCILPVRVLRVVDAELLAGQHHHRIVHPIDDRPANANVCLYKLHSSDGVDEVLGGVKRIYDDHDDTKFNNLIYFSPSSAAAPPITLMLRKVSASLVEWCRGEFSWSTRSPRRRRLNALQVMRALLNKFVFKSIILRVCG